jgi:hypothetical protein
MANGDPLRCGLTQPPDNRATSATMLVHNGSAFGTQSTAFWVVRRGAPPASAAIRGENFSTGLSTGQTKAGVLGMCEAAGRGVGVVGTATGQPNLFFGETGVLGVTNSFGVVGRALTGLIVDEPGSFVSATGVVGECRDGVGVHGLATTGWGIIGQSTDRAGVTGTSVRGVGVEARSERAHGVQARSQSGTGVVGESTSAEGVRGVSTNASGVEGITDQGLAGVRGRATRLYGVFGESTQGVGVFGTSSTNAIRGVSTGSAGGSIGVSGLSEGGAGVAGDSTTGIGVQGRSARGWAGYFEGNVLVRGGLFVVGGPKSAAVAHPDGTHRAMYCVESPECYFEDFGEVTLSGPSVTVRLDRDFAALVKRRHYHVFLTGYGPDAVYVARRSRDAFQIARLASGSSIRMRVSYRIVARRADVKATRLPKVAVASARGASASSPATAARAARSKAALPRATFETLPREPRTTRLDVKRLTQASTAIRKRRTRSGQRSR